MKQTSRRGSPTLHPAPPPDTAAHRPRMVSRGEADRVVTYGMDQRWWKDIYHSAMHIPWWGFLLVATGIYSLTNLVFAGLYLLQPGAIAGVGPLDFADAFFFSVQTMATIGYGHLVPQTVYANILVTIEALIGLLMIALSTGLVFARFSRPTARILFSRVAVVGPHNGQPTLSARAGNERRNQIVQADVTMSLLRNELTVEGATMRRFHNLRLLRTRSPIFTLTFVIMHPIDTDSPLYGATPASLAAENAEVLVTVSGLDETMSQPIHAQASYTVDEILWDHRFADIFGFTETGTRAIDFRRFHDADPV